MKLAILANGPGEVWGWSRPLIQEALRRNWQPELWLLPCPFASGREFEAMSTLGIQIYGPWTALKTLRQMKTHRSYGAVLQLGGDLIFGRFLAALNGAPLACYTYGRKKGLQGCSVVMTSRPGMLPGIDALAVGDLVLDSIDPGTPAPWRAPEGQRLLMFPGSRPVIRHKALPYMQAMLPKLKQRFPALEARVLLSPFAEPSEQDQWRRAGFSTWTGSTAAGLVGGDLALTQPGTNTVEMIYCLQPMAVAVPFAFLREIPSTGLAGLLSYFPGMGLLVRDRMLAHRATREKGRLAWPNRLLGREEIPEFVGELSPEDLAEVLGRLLANSDALKRQRQMLKELADGVIPGASGRICDIIERLVAPSSC